MSDFDKIDAFFDFPKRKTKKNIDKDKSLEEVTADGSEISDSDIRKLIEAVELVPEIWNKGHMSYRDMNKRRASWISIERDVGFLLANKGANASRLWEKLTGAYKRERARISKAPSGSGRSDVEVRWPYYFDLSFLEMCRTEHEDSEEIISSESCESATSESKKIAKSTPKRKRIEVTLDDESLGASETPKRRRSMKKSSEDDWMKSIMSKCDSILNMDEEKPNFGRNSDILETIDQELNKLDSSAQLQLKFQLFKTVENFRLRRHQHVFTAGSSSRPQQTLAEIWEPSQSIDAASTSFSAHDQHAYGQDFYSGPSFNQF